jgi:hypothetical protein
MLRIPQFLRGYDRLVLVGASHEYILPGIIISKTRAQLVAKLEYLLDGTNDKWLTKLIEADLPDEVIWDNNLKGKSSLKIPGIVNISGGLTKADKGTVTIGKVHSRQFDINRPDLMELSLRERIKKWRKSSPEAKRMYRRIKGKRLICASWYATEIVLKLEAPRAVDLQAEIKAKIQADGGGQVEWVDKTSLKIAGNDKVPFAIQYWEI